jgi:hypothetical protein
MRTVQKRNQSPNSPHIVTAIIVIFEESFSEATLFATLGGKSH